MGAHQRAHEGALLRGLGNAFTRARTTSATTTTTAPPPPPETILITAKRPLYVREHVNSQLREPTNVADVDIQSRVPPPNLIGRLRYSSYVVRDNYTRAYSYRARLASDASLLLKLCVCVCVCRDRWFNGGQEQAYDLQTEDAARPVA